MDNLTIDFETYFTKEYSLKVMSPQQYILDPRFEVVLVSVQKNEGAPVWFSGTFAETRQFLRSFDWENSRLIAHHAMFDAGILAMQFNMYPKESFCTMLGARPFFAPFILRGSVSLMAVANHLGVGEKGTDTTNTVGLRRADFSMGMLVSYGSYCDNDVSLAYSVFKKLQPMFPPKEMRLISMSIDKFIRPQLVLDTGALQEALVRIKLGKEAALHDAGITSRDVLMSNTKFAGALVNLGVSPPTKISPRTGKQTFAFAKTDPGMKELLSNKDPRVVAIAAARLQHKSTIEETRVERLLALSHLHSKFGVILVYYGAHTGRYAGGGKVNLQNLTRKSVLREAITAPPGYKILAGDLSQIEARIVACLAGQLDLVASFARGDDVYCVFGSIVYGYPVNKNMELERFVGKQGILQLGYGAGHNRFLSAMHQFSIDMLEDEAERIVKTYRNTYPEIPKLWRRAQGWINTMTNSTLAIDTYGPLTIYSSYGPEKQPAILLPNGMPMYYPDLYMDSNREYWYTSRTGVKRLYGGALIENICQALARIVIVEAELTLDTYGIHTCNQIHDEIHIVVLEEYVNKYKKIMELALVKPVPWMPNLPLACEVGVGDNYAEAH